MEGTKIKIPQRKKARIEIIPLIDVIFFLLATFVLFTLSLNRIGAIPVDLPVPQPPSGDPPENVIIQVSAEGTVYWNRELIELADVPSRIGYYKTQTKDPRIMVSGDDKARFGAMVTVLDKVREAGIEKFSVETNGKRGTGK